VNLSNDEPANDVQAGKAPDNDTRLALLLDDLIGRVQRKESVDFAEVAGRHPEWKEELRELWGAVLLADAAAQSHAHDSSSATAAWSGQELELPARIGDYELLHVLGRGGMGVVYLARQVSLGRKVAVKMILRGAMATDADVARFQAEAEAAAKLEHPGIVPVYEVGQHQDLHYFSMKYVAGPTLAQKYADESPEPREAARILLAVARAIHFAHQHGVLHRDLKPSNILLDADGAPHVTDFGLAKQASVVDGMTLTGAILGTPSYMSPEQAAGGRGNIGPASDVYSLGAVLYHLLAGRPPFRAATFVDTVLLVLEQEPALPHEVDPKADRDLEMIAMHCLQKPSDLRYASAAELADDLNAYLHDEPISARGGKFSQVVSRLFRDTHHAPILENWGLLWMWHSLALLLICLGTNAMFWWGDRQRLHYAFLWIVGAWTWALIFWVLRRRAGPVTFIERQIAHVWAASMVAVSMLFPLELWLDLPVLSLAPVLGLISGMVFLIKAGILSGVFYLQAAALFATSALMARWPNFAHLIFGVVSAACFFFPGWKYHQRRLASRREK